MLDTTWGPRIGDAFGVALRQHWRGHHRTFEFIERDDGLVAVNDLAPYLGGLSEWSALERSAATTITGRVLDLGCGAGRHALPLTRLGHDVLGVDASPGAVTVVRERGVDAIVGSADALPPGIGVFGTVLLFGNNVGLLGGRAQAPRVLGELTRVSTPDTVVLASGFDPHHSDAPEHRDYHRRNLARGRMPGQVRMRIRHARLATPYFDYLLCSPSELADLLHDSPWQLTDLQHDDGHSYLARITRTDR